MAWAKLSGTGSPGPGSLNGSYWTLVGSYLVPNSNAWAVLVGAQSTDIVLGTSGLVARDIVAAINTSTDAVVISLKSTVSAGLLTVDFTGSGAFQPLKIQVGGPERARFTTGGDFSISTGGTIAWNLQQALRYSGGRVQFSDNGSTWNNLASISAWTLSGSYLFPNSTTDIVLAGLTSTDFVPGTSAFIAKSDLAVVLASTDSTYVGLKITPSVGIVACGITGAASYVPLTFQVGGAEQMRMPTAGGMSLSTGGTFQWALQPALRYSGGHVQFSDDGSTWNNISGGSSQWTLTGSYLYPNSTTDIVLAGLTTTDIVPGNSAFVARHELWAVTSSIDAHTIGVSASSGSCSLVCSVTGAASFVPLVIQVGGVDRIHIDTAGNVAIGSPNTNSPAGLGGSIDQFKLYSSTGGILAEIVSDAGAGSFVSFELEVFGNSSGPYFRNLSARGTASSPTNTLANDSLLHFTGCGWAGTGIAEAVAITYGAGSNWSSTSAETFITFMTTANGSLTLTEVARYTGNGIYLVGLASTDSGAVTGGIVAKSDVISANATTNAILTGIKSTASQCILYASVSGTATFQPLVIEVGGPERARFTTAGNFSISSGGAIQFALQSALRYSGGHLQGSDDGSTWVNLCVANTNYWTLSGTLLFPTSTSYSVYVGRTTDDGTGALFQVNGAISASGAIITAGSLEGTGLAINGHPGANGTFSAPFNTIILDHGCVRSIT